MAITLSKRFEVKFTYFWTMIRSNNIRLKAIADMSLQEPEINGVTCFSAFNNRSDIQLFVQLPRNHALSGDLGFWCLF